MGEPSNPKERAQKYTDAAPEPAKPAEDPRPAAKRTPEQWENFVSQRIEEAMRAGHFDNLRNKGKPLEAVPDPHVPADMQMANALLRNNDLAPAWIGDRTAILEQIERFRTTLRRRLQALGEEEAAAVTAVQGEHAALARRIFLADQQNALKLINDRIQVQNLRQPVTFLEIVKLVWDDEVRRATSAPPS